jgi:hypothetical protein
VTKEYKSPSQRATGITEARRLLVKLIDTYDNQEFGGENPVTFGDMRQLIGYAEQALEALKEADCDS